MRPTNRLSQTTGVLAMVMIAMGGPVCAYTTVQTTTLSASASIGGGNAGSGGALALSVPQTLPFQAFFGKNIVVPLQLQGPTSTLSQVQSLGTASGIGVQMMYQPFNPSGAALGDIASVPVSFQSDPNSPATLSGTAMIPVQALQSVRQGGSLAYYFLLQNGSQQTIYRDGAAPFRVQFIDTLSFPVSDAGSIVTLPDTALTDGKTNVVFSPGVLSNPGTLIVHQQDPSRVPSGPGGLLPIVAYDFELQGASWLGSAQVTLSYPSNPDGSIIGSNANPSNLALYGLQGPNWLPLGPRQWNSTLHTIAGPSTKFNSYALFLAAASAADLRPKQRVLTPNGDGVNDTVDFAGIGLESVHLFDVKGRRIRTLQFPTLAWDGRDDNGHIVESGIYIYQYMSQGDRISGVILIAK